MGPPSEWPFPSDHFVAVLGSSVEGTCHRVEHTTVPNLEAHGLAEDSEHDEQGLSRKALQRQGHLDKVLKNEEEPAKASRDKDLV